MTLNDTIEILKEEKECLNDLMGRTAEGSDFELACRMQRFKDALNMALMALDEWNQNLDIKYDYEALAKQYRGMSAPPVTT